MNTQTLNRKIHIAGGGLVFLISLFTYIRTVAPTTSFWDCGEFIACSNILGVMHPPGSPLYLLIGRILTMLPYVKDVGLRLNLFSVFVSAATILLTYLVIVQLIQRWRGQAKSWEDRLIVYLSGIFGALTFAFTDSFWFNAVEAEVYAFSMFFTALVVWLALLWGERSEKTGSLLIIFFIFYLFGLAAGVHLLNILAFPFVILIVYFHHNVTVRRLMLLIFVQVSLPVLLYITLYQFNPHLKSHQELLSHQSHANTFITWFGFIWVAASLIYIFIKDRKVFFAWWVIPILGLIAYTTYLAIFIRAGLEPPINENAPSTLNGMLYYLSRKQYGDQSMLLTFLHREADFWRYQVQKMFTRYFGWQYIGKGTLLDYRDRIIKIISFRGLYGLPFLVGLWGAVFHFKKDWRRAVAVLVLFFLMGYAIIIYLNQPDPQPRERDYSYVGAFFAFALWIGLGMAGVFEWISDTVRRNQKLKLSLIVASTILLFIAVPINLFSFNFHSHDRSGNTVASDYAYNILNTCEPDGIIFTNGDNDTFPLWYLQEVEGVRKDVRVVCLSLLNASWYIMQLQDQEPKIPIRLKNSEIENISPVLWKSQQIEIPISPDVLQELRKNPKIKDRLADKITFVLEPAIRSGDIQALRVQDLMILRILLTTQWKRPVYFATSVSTQNMIGLQRYLRMEGMAFRVLPYPVDSIDPDIMRTNLLEKYRYRRLNDPGVHFGLEIIRLLQNYRTSFQQLANYEYAQGNKTEAARVLNEMRRHIPDKNIPFYSELGALFFVDLYRKTDPSGDYSEMLDHVYPGKQNSRGDALHLVGYYLRELKDWERAETVLSDILSRNANDTESVSLLVQTYVLSKQYAKAVEILQEWIDRHPDDTNAREDLESLKEMTIGDSIRLE